MNTLMNVVETAVTNNVVLNDTAVSIEDKSYVAIAATKFLTRMETKRITWEQGVYRTSNLDLYSVLADCLLFSGELPVAESKQRSAALEAFFKERGYKYKKDSHIIARVVRAVFGNIDRRRVSTYVLVLRQAQKSNVESSQLAQWIEDCGGIQEIKLSRSATFVSPTAKASIAKSDFVNLPVLAIAKSEQLTLLADAGFIGEDFVKRALLMRHSQHYIAISNHNKWPQRKKLLQPMMLTVLLLNKLNHIYGGVMSTPL